MTTPGLMERIRALTEKPQKYYEIYNRPMKNDYEEVVTPLLEAIELLAEEVEALRASRPEPEAH